MLWLNDVSSFVPIFLQYNKCFAGKEVYYYNKESELLCLCIYKNTFFASITSGSILWFCRMTSYLMIFW